MHFALKVKLFAGNKSNEFRKNIIKNISIMSFDLFSKLDSANICQSTHVVVF
jgi:hypothetical protein